MRSMCLDDASTYWTNLLHVRAVQYTRYCLKRGTVLTASWFEDNSNCLCVSRGHGRYKAHSRRFRRSLVLSKGVDECHRTFLPRQLYSWSCIGIRLAPHVQQLRTGWCRIVHIIRKPEQFTMGLTVCCFDLAICETWGRIRRYHTMAARLQKSQCVFSETAKRTTAVISEVERICWDPGPIRYSKRLCVCCSYVRF